MPNFVNSLTSQNFDQVTGQIAMNAGLLLFTNKKETPGVFKALAIKHKEDIVFAVVSSKDTELCERLGVTSFPKVMMMFGVPAPDAERGPNGEVQMSLQMQPYDGPLKYKFLSMFVR